jgi:hypothetical protein
MNEVKRNELNIPSGYVPCEGDRFICPYGSVEGVVVHTSSSYSNGGDNLTRLRYSLGSMDDLMIGTPDFIRLAKFYVNEEGWMFIPQNNKDNHG